MTESKYRLFADTRSSGALPKTGSSKIALSAETDKEVQGQGGRICGAR